jgi:hypothetical protein
VRADDRMRLFGISNQMAERELDRVENQFRIDLHRGKEEVVDEQYYPQFDVSLRSEAAQMGEHYELFYCLEKSIRELISETLEAAKGANWWGTCVPPDVGKNVANAMQRERDSGITPRSEAEIDYATFGELGEIVRTNKSEFGALFSSPKAFDKIMANLNALRNPIAHCSPLAEDEVTRLKLSVRDWFRLME